jgi:hypothetical protein
VFEFFGFQGENVSRVEICCNLLDIFLPATDKIMSVQVYTFRFGVHIQGACSQVAKASETRT